MGSAQPCTRGSSVYGKREKLIKFLTLSLFLENVLEKD